jgi:GT2 family glycosyltransferase/glycosyltransferase involved in cell wall biosynthesis
MSNAEVNGSLPIGHVDVISHESISGWAWDPTMPDSSVDVDIYDGDELLARVPADIYRGDLQDAGVGKGRHGFSLPNPSGLLPFASHKIAVRRAPDGIDLPGSPQWLMRPAAGFDLSLAAFLEGAAGASAQSARKPEDLDQQIQINLRILRKLVDAKNVLLAREPQADAPNGRIIEQGDVLDSAKNAVAPLRADFEPLHFAPVEKPVVSIVIPVFNKFRTTYNCLRSIAAHPPDCSFELLVVDDGSHDETLFGASIASGAVRFIRNSSNEGFVRACNLGARHAKGEYLFFLNNDTLVRPAWLDELVSTFERTPNCGIVGSKLLFANGSLQEAGGIIWRLGDGWNWGRRADPNDPRFCYLRSCDYVSGAALMIRRELFERLGGFDDLFAPGYYEDSDLCFRAREAGERVLVQPTSQIIHLEGLTAGVDLHGEGMKRCQLVNQRKFYERWKRKLATHRLYGDQVELEAERTVTQRAYFIDNTILTPEHDAGSNAALQHIYALMNLGYKVTFLPADNMAQLEPYTANLQKVGVECLYAPYFSSVEDVFRRTQVKPDLVYFHRFLNVSKYANLVHHHFPQCFTVYSVADLHFLRQERQLALTGSISDPRVTEEAELEAMQQVDSVIVHSSAEAKILQAKAPSLRIHTVPWSVLPRRCTVPFSSRAGYGFVGGYGHRPNVDAAEYLAREISPLLKRMNPDIVGFLIGSHMPDHLAALATDTLKVRGFVPDLSGVLHQLRCTVAPLRYGAGLKGKILESLAHGLPCVMTEIAAEGLNLPKQLRWLVASSSQGIAKKLVEVHENESLNAELTEVGLEYIAHNYAPGVIQELLLEAITKRV